MVLGESPPAPRFNQLCDYGHEHPRLVMLIVHELCIRSIGNCGTGVQSGCANPHGNSMTLPMSISDDEETCCDKTDRWSKSSLG